MERILDTSALIEWERAIEAGRELTFPAEAKIALPAIVWAEGLLGARMADSFPPSPRSRREGASITSTEFLLLRSFGRRFIGMIS